MVTILMVMYKSCIIVDVKKEIACDEDLNI